MADLKEYSREHVFYEVSMFFYIGLILESKRLIALNPAQAHIINFALIESFVLHLRNVLDFFYEKPEREQPDDVTARMYYEGSKLPKGFPMKPKVLKKAHFRSNKEMSHLTTLRLGPNDKKKAWRWRELMLAMQPLVRNFVDTASRSKLHEDFIRNTSQLLDGVSRAL